ncbi:hypothetical protein L3i23_20330 [Herbiconiux sp. L3-i23]|nr:hypothetical protein L3i23_20330 [Herbiconiux sp. L3-i23]
MVVGAVAVLILALAVYGPVALLAPLPAADGVAVSAESVPSESAPVVALSADGASAVTLSADAAPLTAGTADPIPMAASAKLVTALVVLEQYPLIEGRAGPAIPVTAHDFAAYSRYQAEGTKAVRVVPGDQWSERETLQATLIASSNNHAEMLARWAFGTMDGYLEAATAWLAEHGLDGTRVADATGLSAESVSTGTDLARLAALAMADPLVGEIVATPSATTLRGLDFENTISYRTAQGLLGISRSYTDEAGVVLLFAYEAEVTGGSATVYGAFAGEPSYDSLDADVSALLASLPTALALQPVVVAGKSYGTFTTQWDQRVDAVAEVDLFGIGWNGVDPGASVAVELEELTVGRKGREVGRVVAETLVGEQSSPLVLAETVGDPGPVWRLLHPGVMVPGFLDMVSSD